MTTVQIEALNLLLNKVDILQLAVPFIYKRPHRPQEGRFNAAATVVSYNFLEPTFGLDPEDNRRNVNTVVCRVICLNILSVTDEPCERNSISAVRKLDTIPYLFKRIS